MVIIVANPEFSAIAGYEELGIVAQCIVCYTEKNVLLVLGVRKILRGVEQSINVCSKERLCF
ncbi:hypothetical protein ACH8ZP_04260 [Chlamydia pneumoniae]|uniref:Uncharacterized protein n=1 Tax=Chlamydia pneumoniae TaxID=83558 RepID=Q9K1T6_CHLPN|nr:hypothetical protein [Chlamydia pneumoniae]AAF38803.1 hypothetical protein CP_1027 [Chlamydia pneumoniae AR39]CRI33362.1 Uncharacterized protein BN1224_Wien1_A_08690 [Chlamydia pneumoniae]CRI36225.1 Uncharacterized protein BN1224_CM1_A_08720 [Chlamydia pneumoniae]CRI37352.1 Uncharacterized protein BN1224_CV14_A_08710 [Chlamydia pneumoniae]CRI38481.1 Uncharacterized protein BN1224_CV15_C_03140 [Chlamydia pneumoniae]